MNSLLDVHDLHVNYRAQTGCEIFALQGVNVGVAQGEILGVLGESGCGKSTLAAALLGILPPNGRIAGGSILFEGENLAEKGRDELNRIRGARISIIFQEPGAALHPTMRIGDQIEEVLRAHGSLNPSARRERAREMLISVFSCDTDRMALSYPHQLSGGQRQRAVIAQAIACRPVLLIADEPTASLDPSTQLDVLSLFRQLNRQLGLALIFITHNPALLAGFAGRVLVLYAGKAIEIGKTESVLSSPQHPYTQALLGCVPVLDGADGPRHGTELPVIPGDAPVLTARLQGCSFEPRCPERIEVCRREEPPEVALEPSHAV